MYAGSPTLGKFYVVTDGNTHPDPRGFALFWDTYDDFGKHLGFPSLKDKYSVPSWVLFPLASAAEWASWMTGIRFKLGVFQARMMTMHRWFNIDAAINELGYEVSRSS